MSDQPPGYNSSESLLQGGNATIHPVMGGGGQESLLHGGNSANIIPLKGGRRNMRSKSRSKSKSRSRSKGRKSSKSYKMQRGGAEISMPLMPSMPATYPATATVVSTLSPSASEAILASHAGGGLKKKLKGLKKKLTGQKKKVY